MACRGTALLLLHLFYQAFDSSFSHNNPALLSVVSFTKVYVAVGLKSRVSPVLEALCFQSQPVTRAEQYRQTYRSFGIWNTNTEVATEFSSF
jgi:hypothetical protein